jgi:dephospho-CoA kinase
VLRVGLTGGIASGKSHVLRRLAARGCHTLDLDRSAREVTAPGSPALAEIEARFGRSVLDASGHLDRAALAALVFANPDARAALNAIVHPRVRELEARWAAAHAARDAVLVTDAALLVEAGVHARFDRLLVVHCPPEIQLARLVARDRLDERAARARIEAQLPASEKRAFAHFEVDSSGTPEATDRRVDAVFEELRALAIRDGRLAAVPRDRLLGALVHGPHVGPRGLSPSGLLQAIGERRGLELQPLAERLEGYAGGPWYTAARQAPPGAPAWTLAAPLVAWALASRPPDPEFLASATGSLARLTHDDATSRGEACLVALLLQEALLEGRVPAHSEERDWDRARLAGRWAGGEGDPLARGRRAAERVASAIDVARRQATDPSAARAEAVRAGADEHVAGALVGAAVGASAAEAPELAALLGAVAGA